MKLLFRLLSIPLFIVLGWILYPSVLELAVNHLESNGYALLSYTRQEQFYAQISFILAFGVIPVLMWIPTKFIKYRSKGFEFFGFFLLTFFGMVSAILRTHSVRPLRTTWNTDYVEYVSFDSLKITPYLMLGVLIGCLAFFFIGLLSKQIKRR